MNSIRSGGYEGSKIPTVYNQFTRKPLAYQSFVIKSALPEKSIVKSLQETARQTDPNIALYDICAFEKRLQARSSLRRISAQTVLLLDGIALGLGSTYYLLPIISRSIFKLPAMTTGVQLFTSLAVLILGIVSCLLAIRKSLDLEQIYTSLKEE